MKPFFILVFFKPINMTVYLETDILFVETCWYMDYISFEEFMRRYFWNIAFWGISRVQNRDFRALDS